MNKGSKKKAPMFSLCYVRGQISLPPVSATPRSLLDLYEDKVKGPRLKSCIRTYNAMLNFSSIGGKIDNSINRGRGRKVFRMTGINHHKMGSLLPKHGDVPKFCQLYIYDTENEIKNRLGSINV